MSDSYFLGYKDIAQRFSDSKVSNSYIRDNFVSDSCSRVNDKKNESEKKRRSL